MKRDTRRQQTQNEPNGPRNNDYQFAIPESYTLTMNGNEFLKYDNDVVRRRMLIFGTTQSIDGQFFHKLFIIRAWLNRNHKQFCLSGFK